jgi:predicted phosphodiesterase
MPRKQLPETKIIIEYIERFPNASCRGLSRKIYEENKQHFESFNLVYGRVKYYLGLNGNRSREEITDKRFQREPKTHNRMLPESHSEKRQRIKLPSGMKKLGVFGDVHIPYHDNDALETMFDKFEEEKVDGIYINGDLLDFYTLSFHEKDPRKARFKDEIEAGREFLEYVRDRFPGIPIYFIPGNHENRLERYLRRKAVEILDVDEFRLDVLLQVGATRIEYIPFRSRVSFGNYLIEHGDKIPGAGGVVPARTALMKLKTNVIINHFHKTSSSSQRVYNIDDSSTINGYSLGCMCELEPEYLEINEWNHGFAILDNKKGKISVRQFKIENGKII